MKIANHAGLTDDDCAALENELAAHGTLLQVMQWAGSRQPPLQVAGVITLDEYTHDLSIRWRDGLTLVFGAT